MIVLILIKVIYNLILGILLEKLGKYDKAVKCYDEAININSKNYSAYHKKG